ncbi:MAG: TlpA family protein disulfide reductase [Myxococcaceae bacterium]|nr:TlpA family protein disulfide reductase [Myxococcaceae bacterium]
MKRSKAILGLVAALWLSGCVTTPQPPPLTGPLPNPDGVAFRAPIFGTQDTYDLTSDRGHVVLVDVWATWCEPCRDALPLWEDVQKEYAARGLKVYALSVDEDPNMVAKFLSETKLKLPVLMDPEGTIVGPVLEVNLMPTTFLIDRKGVIRFKHEGFAPEFLQKYQSEIEQLLAENP